MTQVHVLLTRPQRGTTDRQPVAGQLDVSLYRREVEGNQFVLITAFSQVLVNGEATLSLTPTDGTNAWVVVERVRDGITRMIGVPNSSSTVEYTALPDLDATTLAPYSGTAAQQQATFRGAWVPNLAYPANSFVTNAGLLYFTDGPVPARATFQASDWKIGTSSSQTPDATATSKGVVQLAGDLAGTAAAPTVVGKLAAAANLSDLASVSTARTNLGLGTAATQPAPVALTQSQYDALTTKDPATLYLITD